MNVIKRMTLTSSVLFSLFLTTIGVVAGNNAKVDAHFKNEELLENFFGKLRNLETNKTGKVNIVHIGDSHVQADFFTDAIRQVLQSRFGNGGYGITFPYSLAKTNGTRYVAYKSNMEWESVRNIAPVSDVEIGISGIGLYINSDKFLLDLTTRDMYDFNTIKIIYPGSKPLFNVALPDDSLYETAQVTKPQSNKTYHVVKSGETLYRISIMNKVSVEQIKSANGLKSNTIKTGQRLIIPQKGRTYVQETKTIAPVFSKADTLILEHGKYNSVYRSEERLSRIFILPAGHFRRYSLSGVVLENDEPGVIYHTIGVNGTKTSDYNKHPLFFEQLPILNPDLLIISLGTNESFGKWSDSEYMYEINKMIANIRKKMIDVPILIMTPPPSLFNRSKPNNFVKEYSEALLVMNDCIIWDLFSKMGGLNAPQKKSNAPLMARDKVHYTKEGYVIQGNIFSTDFLNAYDNYIKRKLNIGNAVR